MQTLPQTKKITANNSLKCSNHILAEVAWRELKLKSSQEDSGRRSTSWGLRTTSANLAG